MMISVNKACSILRELTYPVTVSADGPDMQYQRCGVVRCKRVNRNGILSGGGGGGGHHDAGWRLVSTHLSRRPVTDSLPPPVSFTYAISETSTARCQD